MCALLSQGRLTLAALLILCFPLLCQAADHRSPNDGSGAFATGNYRNLFAEAGHPQAQIDAKIHAAYAQLFHGDPRTQAVVFLPDPMKTDR